MAAPTATNKALAPGEAPAARRPATPRASHPWRLLAWLLIPTLLAVGSAALLMDWTTPAASQSPPRLAASGRPTTAPPGAAPVSGTPEPASRTPVPSATPLLVSSTALTPTPDLETLALLTALPATLPVTSSAAISLSPAPGQAGVPTDAPDTLETRPPDAPRPATPVSPAPPPPRSPIPPVDPGAGSLDPITGLPADPAMLARIPIVAMIDNHPDAAPQTGLNSADMIIEALAEGGITRFETFFQTGDAPTLGPVRSARPYYVEWAYPYRPLYVHCGGSWEAIDLIREATGILTDVDCFNGNMPFWRSSDRLLPHNLYTSTDQLWKLAARRGLGAPPSEPAFLHSPALPAEQRPTSASLSFVFSKMSRSDVTWVYDPDNNRYLRKQWGYWHRDLATNEIISARDVVVLWTNVWELSGDEKGRLGADTIGQGTALILRDGQFEWGYWARTSPYAPLNLYNGKHDAMPLAPGRLWIEVLGIGQRVQIAH